MTPQFMDHAALDAAALGTCPARAELREAAAASRGYEAAKRGFDLVFALLLLIATLPIALLAAAAIKMTSPGPLIFTQSRLGRNGAPFTIYKFRTMVSDASARLLEDERLRRDFQLNWKLRDDPRVTRVGRWLRTTSIDELPQLVNVIRGQMSIVGPRPVQLPEAARQYGGAAEAVFSVKPGLTGLWQVSGRSRLSYQERVALDLEYLRRRGLRTDVLIVIRTIPAVLFKPDAH